MEEVHPRPLVRLTGGHLDQWSPGDLSLLSLGAFEALATMLNLVEGGCEWPTHLRKARAAFLAKDPGNPHDPLAQRLLLMLPAVYRLWGRVRLRQLSSWAAAWDSPESYAGTNRRGPGQASPTAEGERDG